MNEALELKWKKEIMGGGSQEAKVDDILADLSYLKAFRQVSWNFWFVMLFRFWDINSVIEHFDRTSIRYNLQMHEYTQSQPNQKFLLLDLVLTKNCV